MKTIKKFPNIAIAFGIVSIATAVILVVDTPQWLNWIFAIFWLGTGVLGLYQGMRQ